MAKLIILRGPSGAGKSTVATHLQQRLAKCVLIEQDYYKEVMIRPKDGSRALRQALLLQDTTLALEHDYDVILEGIMHREAYEPMFAQIFRSHPDHNYLFYFDVPFDETLRRHASRPAKRDLFGEAEMQEWFTVAGPLGHAAEIVIPAKSTLEQTLTTIESHIGITPGSA